MQTFKPVSYFKTVAPVIKAIFLFDGHGQAVRLVAVNVSSFRFNDAWYGWYFHPGTCV